MGREALLVWSRLVPLRVCGGSACSCFSASRWVLLHCISPDLTTLAPAGSRIPAERSAGASGNASQSPWPGSPLFDSLPRYYSKAGQKDQNRPSQLLPSERASALPSQARLHRSLPTPSLLAKLSLPSFAPISCSTSHMHTLYNNSQALLPSKQPAREPNPQHHPSNDDETGGAPHASLRPKDLFLLIKPSASTLSTTSNRLTSLQSALLSSGFPLVHSFGPPNPLTTLSSSTSRSVKSNPPTNAACFPTPMTGSGKHSLRAPRTQRKGQRMPQRK